MSGSENKITFDYIKSNYFRVLHVDELSIERNPQGDIQIILWNERNSIPKRIVYTLSPDGSISDEEIIEECESRGSIVREIEASFSIDLDTAKRFAQLLENFVNKVEEIQIAESEVK
ncbi:MAG: hypothetical protein RLZZ04_2902 [Cyanobacteriota bacterium]|jgi:hypothetical protein